ncbi:MAG: hypothetical protein E7296_07685 [Lachnospiraceae bacterium]|nr:hypothetical protein [Lachnospiraceae bacterium]
MPRTNVPFTPEQKAALEANPFTLMVNEYQIRFTIEFKKFILSERAKNNTKWKDIIRKAGYDPEVLGRERIDGIIRTIRRESKSPKGLHETTSQRSAIKDQKKQRLEARVHDLEDEIVLLNQKIDFLKKTQMLQVLEDNEG